jgi:aminoglycoside 2''-phosphotransferase
MTERKIGKMNASNPKHLDRIRECFPALILDSIQLNQDGLVNDVLIVNGELVFRFPKNETWARALLANEVKVMELAQGYLDVRIPSLEYRADDFVAYRLIEGVALRREIVLRLGAEAQEQVVCDLANYLRQLHSIPLEDVARRGISPSDVNRGPGAWARLFEDVQRELFPLMMPHAREWAAELFAPVLADEHWMDYSPSLINGDTSPYHLLFDRRAGRVSGVIDFGTAGVGDPAADFACVIHYYGESFLRRMAAYYQEIGDGVDRARFWAGTLELQWALAGVRAREASWSWLTAHLGSAKDVSPVGAGWRGAGV